MDDYVSPPRRTIGSVRRLKAFAGRTPQELIADGRIRDLVIESTVGATDTRLTFNARQRAAIKRWMGQAVP